MSDSPTDLRDLPPEKRALLALKALRAKKQGANAARRQTIPRLPRREGINSFPLSSAQERLWFLDQFAPESLAYSLPISVRLHGQLDVPAFEQSLNEIVRRHEVLRTSLAQREAQPVQLIAPALELKPQERDLRHLPRDEREAEARRIAAEESRKPFNLACGPLLRVTLLRMGEQDHIVLLLIHHIVFDGWSIGVFSRELAVLYQAFSQGKPSPLPPTDVQYADFAVWQRRWLQGDEFRAQLDYWKKQLGGHLPVLELPVDRPREAAQSSRGAKQAWKFPKPLLEGLKALGQRENATLFMILLAAFKALLHRYTGQEDVIVGSPVANRNYAELEGLIGFFLNTLPLRTSLAGNPTFREALARERETVLQALAHQDVPFEKLVQELHPERSMNRRHSLFQVAFILQNASTKNLSLAGLTPASFQIDSAVEIFSDLNLYVMEGADETAGVLEYNADLFDGQTMTRLIGHFQRLLEGVIADPRQRLSDLPLLTDAERHQLLVEWNETAVGAGRELRVHEMFAEQARTTPDSTALIFGGEQLTYRELDSRADQLAARLRSGGVGPDVLVGICMNRSPEMVVALLGVLKAGGAYVPLDPEYPQARLASMMEDAGVSLLLTQERLLGRLPAHRAEVILPDKNWETMLEGQPGTSAPRVSAGNLTYVTYTSGSTGKPKGIAMTHDALSNLIGWQCRHPVLSKGRRRLQFASLSFDASFREIFSTLCSGGTLLLVTEETRRDPNSLADFIADNSVEKILLPFVALQQLAEELTERERPLTSLCEVITAGEQLRITPPIEKLFDRLKHCSLHNHYGPSESHMVTTFPLEGTPDRWPRLPPIGRPIANTQTYILDAHLQPVPVGVTGELYIGGPCLARGYFHRPALTAEKFVPHPFGQPPGARLYKTGDLARYLPDGNIQFLGRTDHQVKIRGYRIEPGEIEVLLEQHPDVREAVVVAQPENEAGQRRLAAYVVVEQQSRSRVGDLRRFLEERLPDYVVPSAFVMLDALPLTPNGKVDRRALPAPQAPRREDDSKFVAPRTAAEKMLADIWAEVLKLEPIGVEDNFISLGGDSLLGFQVVARANRKGLKLSLQQFFSHPTIAELVRLDEAARHAPTERTETLAPAGAASWKGQTPGPQRPGQQPEDVYPLSPMQQGILFHCLYDPSAVEYVEQGGFAGPVELDVAAFERAWRDVLRRHTILRTAFAWEGLDEPLQAVFPAVNLPLELHELSDMPPSEQPERIANYIEEVRREGFDLTRAPLLRLALFHLAGGSYQFVLSHHHLLLDGWSRTLLLNEVEELYEAFKQQRAVEAEREDCYRDYIEWLRRQDLRQAEAYWRRVLGGLSSPTTLALGGNRHAAAATTQPYAEQQAELSPRLTARLQQLARRHQLTMNTVVQGAWALLLSRYGGEREVLFGNVVSGRTVELAEAEQMVGLFINTLPVRVKVDGGKVLVEWLRNLQAEQLEVRQYEYSPLVEIQKWSDVPRGTPLFESILTYATYPAQRQGPWTFVDRSLERTGYPLDVLFTAGEKLSVRITYQVSRYAAAEIEGLLEYLRELLEGMAANPEGLLSELPLLPEADRRRIMSAWNETQRDFPLDRCFHQLFEAQAARSPDAVAVTFGTQQQTYRELNRNANRLARGLVELGVGPDVIVTLFAERGIAFLTAVLAIFKAGGAYLPLDPSHPVRRNLDLLAQSGASLVLQTRDSVPVFSRAPATGDSPMRARVLYIDELIERSPESENLPPRSMPFNLAYVIYTSGSTGRPKGVMVEQRGMLNHLFAKISDLRLVEADIIAQTASQCFDISVWQFLAALLVGGQTHVVNDAVVYDSRLLLREVEGRGVSILETVPSLLGVMLEEMTRRDDPPRPALAALRWLIPTGEALPPVLCRRWLDAYPRIPMLNAYGPTECSDDVAHHAIYQVPSPEVLNVPVGRPVANTRLYVLDQLLQLVPVGVAGELCVSGVGVGRGYLNDPRRTAAAFVPDPFSRDEGARLYRTGDRARHLPDGTIEFLGRRDEQVKVRGHRIELGEIETVIGHLRGVRQAVVVVREQRPGDKRLVAYVVPRQDVSFAPDELRRHLGEQLPDYMVPSDFVILDDLPLTANGKIDHQSLPSPRQSKPETDDLYEPPRNSTEQALAEIWAEVLGVERAGIQDNFFDLGGHSLLATQVVSRLHHVLNVEVGVRAVFESPTLAELALVVERKQMEQLSQDKLSQVFAELDELSEEEAEALLASGQAGDFEEDAPRE
jgi:amino acid adenylation domain-containing protein